MALFLLAAEAGEHRENRRNLAGKLIFLVNSDRILIRIAVIGVRTYNIKHDMQIVDEHDNMNHFYHSIYDALHKIMHK